MGFGTSLANEGDEHDDDDEEEEEEEEAEEEEEEAMAGGGGGEAGAEALSKRAVKRQRKRELSEAAAIAAQPIASGFGVAAWRSVVASPLRTTAATSARWLKAASREVERGDAVC